MKEELTMNDLNEVLRYAVEYSRNMGLTMKGLAMRLDIPEKMLYNWKSRAVATLRPNHLLALSNYFTTIDIEAFAYGKAMVEFHKELFGSEGNEEDEEFVIVEHRSIHDNLPPEEYTQDEIDRMLEEGTRKGLWY